MLKTSRIRYCQLLYPKSWLAHFPRPVLIDYFPSYELISSHVSRGALHEQNLRNVNAEGVAAAMQMFFSQHPVIDKHGARAFGEAQRVPEDDDAEARCDEELLEAFAP